ncbi:MAG: penicillin-binding protein 2 [Clostridiaceae bacterium]
MNNAANKLKEFLSQLGKFFGYGKEKSEDINTYNLGNENTPSSDDLNGTSNISDPKADDESRLIRTDGEQEFKPLITEKAELKNDSEIDAGEDAVTTTQEETKSTSSSDGVFEYNISDLTKENTKNNMDQKKSLEERYLDNFDEERKILRRNIKRLTAITMALFFAVASYIVYFQVVRAPELKSDPANRRNAEARNTVQRGTIFDRNGKILSESILDEDGLQSRQYHGGEALGNILGYVSDKYSLTGMEQVLDEELSKDSSISQIFSMDFITNLLNRKTAVTKKQRGHSVKLTLDYELQRFAYNALEGRKGSVVALNPKTGEILALVSSPGFDAADLDSVMEKVNSDSEYAANAPLVNRAVNGKYAPGSTFKIITLASAVDNIAGVRDRIFKDTGVIEFPDGSKINNFLNYANGNIDLLQGFMYSSNFVFGTLGMELSNTQLRSSAEKFGFNRKIDIMGLSVSESKFPSMNDAYRGDKALTAIGQGEVSTTPLEMAMISSAVANAGKLMQPQIVKEIIDKNSVTLTENTPTLFSTALSENTATVVGNYMRSNVKNTETYSTFKSISGAGKTGTAQFSSGDTMRIHAWFTGFAPFDDPKIAIAVILEDLDDVVENTGARQAIPVAKSIMEYYLNNN